MKWSLPPSPPTLTPLFSLSLEKTKFEIGVCLVRQGTITSLEPTLRFNHFFCNKPNWQLNRYSNPSFSPPRRPSHGAAGDGIHGVGDRGLGPRSPLPALLCRHNSCQLPPPIRPRRSNRPPLLRRRNRGYSFVPLVRILLKSAFHCADAFGLRVHGALSKVLWHYYFLSGVWIPHRMVCFFCSVFISMLLLLQEWYSGFNSWMVLFDFSVFRKKKKVCFFICKFIFKRKEIWLCIIVFLF